MFAFFFERYCVCLLLFCKFSSNLKITNKIKTNIKYEKKHTPYLKLLYFLLFYRVLSFWRNLKSFLLVEHFLKNVFVDSPKKGVV